MAAVEAGLGFRAKVRVGPTLSSFLDTCSAKSRHSSTFGALATNGRPFTAGCYMQASRLNRCFRLADNFVCNRSGEAPHRGGRRNSWSVNGCWTLPRRASYLFLFRRKPETRRDLPSTRVAIIVIMSHSNISKSSLFATWNWSRGLFRLWVVASVCWEVFWLGALWIEGPRGADPTIILLIFFGAPASLLIFGGLVRWAIGGFREPERQDHGPPLP